jgi:Protein of unknown function (DUF3396)
MRTTICKKYPETGRIYLREAMSVVLFFEPPVHEAVDGLRRAFEFYLGKVPTNALTWSSVGATSEEWKPMVKTTISRCLGQLNKEAAAKRKVTSFELTDGEVGGGAPGYSFKVIGRPREEAWPDTLGLLQMTFPMETVDDGTVDPFVKFCKQGAALIPFVSGYAAPGLQWAEVNSGLAADESKAIAIRHPGYDVQNNSATRLHLGKRTRGAYWLTFLGPELVEALGGSEQLRNSFPKPIDVEPVGAGVMIRAGALPELGDVNKGIGVPLLRAVAKVIEPVTFFGDRALLGQFTNFDEDYFKRWDRRLFS